MDLGGGAFPITPLLATCTKIVTILHNVGKKFKRAPLMMTSIATECSLIHVALAQLRSFDWAAVSTHADGREKGVRATESIILGCTLTLSVIEEYAIELQDYVDGTPISPTEQMGIMARARVLWKEDEMRELLLQLRGYQTGLTSLIRAAQDSDFGESSDVSGSNYILLLQRSRSSRARKPLSIRAAMQQAATYSNITPPTPSTTKPSTQPSVGTSSGTSTGTGAVQPRQSTAAANIMSKTASESKSNTTAATSNSDNNNGDASSSIVLDSYDNGAATVPAGKKGTSEAARRKRPAFLSLQPEDSDARVDGQTLYTKKSKDQMRKSSPTVGDKFKFVPGEPPAHAPISEMPSKSTIPTLSHKNDVVEADVGAKKAKRPSNEPFMTPPTTSPPTAPLPEPPSNPSSRSPSRSRSPVPKSPGTSILRTSIRAETLSSRHSIEPRKASASPPKQFQNDDQSRQDGSPAVDREPDIPLTPRTPAADASVSPTPRYATSQPRKQKSNSSVRDQIMVLPETARLRKQASNDLLRKQSSAELLSQTGFHEAVPALPPPNQDRYVMGNAFVRRGSESQQPPGNPIIRTTSYDLLTDSNRKRSATDTAQNTDVADNKLQLPLHTKRGLQRSASDVRRPPHLQFANGDTKAEATGHSPTSDAVTTPSTIGTPTSQRPASATSEAWPLSQSQGHLPQGYPPQGYPAQGFAPPGYKPELAQHQTNYGPRRNIQTSGGYHMRSSSHESVTPAPSRSLSPETTPRGSRSITPHASFVSTPRQQRSRTNTLLTAASEAGEPGKHTSEEISSIYGSTTPSVMSAQWYRSPQERLNIGPRMSRSDDDNPWENLGDEDIDPVTDQSKSRFPQRARLGGVLGALPGRAPPRNDDDQAPPSPPRSPLLTDGFLSNVKTGLPKEGVQGHRMPPAPDMNPRPSTSMQSYGDSSNSSEAQSKKSKKDKKKKESNRPTFRELWKEYKSSSDSWYTGQYQRAAEEQRSESVARDKRPATGSTTTGSSSSGGRMPGSIDAQASMSGKSAIVPTPRQSTERGGSISSGSANSRLGSEKEKPKKKGGLMSVKELWGEYKASTNAWYTAGYKEENMRHLETPDLLGRRY